MSEVKVNKISPRTNCGTTTLGDSGDTFNIPCGSKINVASGGNITVASGATITNNGTQTGFGRTGTVNWNTTVQTSTITVADGSGYFVNTTGGAITANLPAGSAGSICAFKDYAGTFDDNKLTISPNGSEKINGIAADYEATTETLSITLTYVDSTKGWMVIHDSTEDVTGGEYITATGGTISTVCTNYKVHVFTGPGTFCVSAGGGPKGKVDYLVLAGGGSGGWKFHGEGGGAGGYRESKCSTVSGCWTASPLASSTSLPLSPGPYAVAVGAGGANSTSGSCGGSNNGVNSSFSSITSAGGGGGGSQAASCGPETPGNDGGSGGGGANTPICTTMGSGNVPPVSPPQGNNGGKYYSAGPSYGSGSGGGAGGVGANGSGPTGGVGGPGATSSITGSPVARGGGGGGASYNGGSGGAGGSGGGGTGTSGGSSNGTTGTVNLGGGGGGGERAPTGNPSSDGWGGGSGTVIIRYRFQ